MPGSTPATSQLDWLISTTAITVLSWSKATRDLLKSFGWGIRALHQLDAATMVPSPRRLPHTISPLEGDGFEPSVPRKATDTDALKWRCSVPRAIGTQTGFAIGGFARVVAAAVQGEGPLRVNQHPTLTSPRFGAKRLEQR